MSEILSFGKGEVFTLARLVFTFGNKGIQEARRGETGLRMIQGPEGSLEVGAWRVS